MRPVRSRPAATWPRCVAVRTRPLADLPLLSLGSSFAPAGMLGFGGVFRIAASETRPSPHRKAVRCRSIALRRHSDEPPERVHIAPVVSGFVDRRFENECTPCERGMIQNSPECLAPNFSFADVFVPVESRT